MYRFLIEIHIKQPNKLDLFIVGFKRIPENCQFFFNMRTILLFNIKAIHSGVFVNLSDLERIQRPFFFSRTIYLTRVEAESSTINFVRKKYFLFH